MLNTFRKYILGPTFKERLNTKSCFGAVWQVCKKQYTLVQCNVYKTSLCEHKSKIRRWQPIKYSVVGLLYRSFSYLKFVSSHNKQIMSIKEQTKVQMTPVTDGQNNLHSTESQNIRLKTSKYTQVNLVQRSFETSERAKSTIDAGRLFQIWGHTLHKEVLCLFLKTFQPWFYCRMTNQKPLW